MPRHPHSQDEGEPVELDERTRVSLKTVVAIVLATCALVGAFYRIDYRFSQLEEHYQAMERHFRTDWAMINQEPWAAELARRNPDLKVPPVRDFYHPDESLPVAAKTP